eukprot:Blabericola_migrator_1__1199@NODE_1307_length_4844_cov_159_193427_g879_i0_p1_GENE_NODE_1307_length_4844_cov_159_193427_g879_i0NODE_1307_length_4844_cov_159_193427_g879_i0_p1_ORF_typecomplete_len1105_score186_19Kelch_3/PF13415_6/1_2Kelch_3/PF13415_6/6_1e10Kelch_3/PF13415_6/4e09Kelch_3/PF13415_6/4_6e07Kelch_3/PF13415_6/1_4e10Kelch_3/PF13415_6/5_4e05Kelch_4/PF13418_6/6_9e09Kelch_4/PF13418_6/1_6e08Kelch_4/PF13418_6/1_5e08Kelch_4/PF13418_6/1_4e07Kelch_4/PF13418_6/9_4e05Kelch_6/PF13964_6/1_3e08Kelch_6
MSEKLEIKRQRSLQQENRGSSGLDRSKFERLSTKGDTPPSRTQHATCAVEGGLYVFGGEVPVREAKQDVQLLNDMYHFNISSGQWNQIKPTQGQKPDKRKGHTMVVAGTSLILFGGIATIGQASGRKSARGNRSSIINENSPTADGDDDAAVGSDLIYYNDLWFFDTVSQVWSEIKVEGDKPPARAHHSAVMTDQNELLIFGGFGCHEDSDVWVFSIRTMSWSRCPIAESSSRPARRWKHGATFYGDCMYVFGGQVKAKLCDSAIWKLNLETHSWSRIEAGNSSQTPPPRRDFAAVCVDNRWIIHGGDLGLTPTTTRTSNALHEFNLRTEKWRTLTAAFNLPPALEAHQAVLVHECPYVGSLIFTNGCNMTGSLPNWPQGGWRTDFLGQYPLPAKIEEYYLHPAVRDIILYLWREMTKLRMCAVELHQTRGDMQMLTTRCEALAADNKQKTANLADVSQDLNTARTLLTRLKADYAECESVKHRQGDEITGLRALVDRLEHQNERYERDLASLDELLKKEEAAKEKIKAELVFSKKQEARRVEEFESELQSLQAREAQLTDECNRLRGEIVDRAQSEQELKRKLTELETLEADLKRDQEALVVDLETSRCANRTLKSQLEALQETHQTHIGETDAQISTMQRELEELRTTLEATKQDYEVQAEKAKDLHDQLSVVTHYMGIQIRDYQQKVKALEDDKTSSLLRKDKEISDLQSQLSAQDARIATLEAEVREKTQKIEEGESELEGLGATIKEKSAEILRIIDEADKVKSEYDASRAMLVDKGRELDEKEKEAAALKAKLAESQSAETQKAAKIERLNQRLKAIQSDVNEKIAANNKLAGNLKAVEAELQKKAAMITRLESDCAGQNNKIDQLNSQLKSSQSEVADKVAANDKLSAVLRSTQDELDARLCEMKEAQDELATAKLELDNLSNERAIEKAEHKEAVALLMQQAAQDRDAYKDSLNAAEAEIKDLSQDLTRTRNDNKTLESQIMALQGELESSKQQLSSLEKCNANLVQQVADNKEEIGNLTAANARLQDDHSCQVQGLERRLESLSAENESNLNLLQSVHKFLGMGVALHSRVENVLRGQVPLSPASTMADLSDLSP